MAKTKIKIKGTDKLSRDLAELVKLGRKPAQTLVLSASAIEVAAKSNIDAKLNKNPTGALRKKVKTRIVNPRTVEVGVFNDVYGRVHEFGATIQGAFGREGSVTIPQRAWLRPAVDSERKQVASILAKELKNQIEQAVD